MFANKRWIAVAVLATAAATAAIGRAPTNAAPEMADLSNVSGVTGLPIGIAGSCSDDGKPEPPSITYQWAKTAGDGLCTFASSTSASTTATCNTAGAVTLQLSCCDSGDAASCSGLSDSDTLTATISQSRIVDQIRSAGYVVRAAFSRSERISGLSTNTQCCLVRRSSDSATLAIGFDPITSLRDNAAIATFCGASSCFLATEYDQSGNGHHRTNATTSQQPKIYDGTTGALVVGTLPVANHDSAIFSSTQWLSSGTQLGYTGTPSITVFYSGRFSDTATYDRFWSSTGGGISAADDLGRGFNIGTRSATGLPTIGIRGGSFSTQWRSFTPAVAISTFAHYIAQIGSGGNVNAAVLRQNGERLTQDPVVSWYTQAAMAGGKHSLGAVSSHNSDNGRFGIDGDTSTDIYIEGHVDGQALADLVAFGDTQLVRAGVTPGSPNITNSSPILVKPAGQSNAGFLNVPDIAPVDYGFYWTSRTAISSTAMDPTWIPGGTGYNQLRDSLLALDPRIKIVIWWVQGENDAVNLTLANAYGTNLALLRNSLMADIGRPIYWVDTLIHSSNAATYRTTVNAQKTSFVASLGAYGLLVDPSTHGTLTDGLHWSEALQDAMAVIVHDAVRAAWM